jgi:Domain of unknown function (DUF4375)
VPATLLATIDQLLALDPDDAGVERLQHVAESLLKDALRSAGRAGVEAQIATLASRYSVQPSQAHACMWRVVLAPPYVLELWCNPPLAPFIAALSYRRGNPTDTKARIAAAKRQAEFYHRYEALMGTRDRLSADDTLVALVGDFEADVNNGGFSQYLANKGMAEAREALAALLTIGAKRTARWLESAVAAGANSPSLEVLDAAFQAKPDDLASLVIRHLKRAGKR